MLTVLFIWVGGNFVLIAVALALLIKKTGKTHAQVNSIHNNSEAFEHMVRAVDNTLQENYRKIIQTCLELKTAFEEIHNNMIAKDGKVTKAIEHIAHDIDRKAESLVPVTTKENWLQVETSSEPKVNLTLLHRLGPNITQRAEIINLYNKGLKPTAIAKKLNVLHKTVTNVIYNNIRRQKERMGIHEIYKAAGIPPMRTRRTKRDYSHRLTEAEKAKITDLYLQGNGPKAIAEKTNIKYSRIVSFIYTRMKKGKK